MKRKYINRLICAVLCLVCIFAISINAEGETPPETTVETTISTIQPVTNPLEEHNTLEGVLYTFITFFFNETTVSAYGEFFVKLSIVSVILLVFWISKSIFGIFKKRR